ncbi:alkaline phosphatase family protein [Aquabacterium sp.]|uniref:alkaline phosphatase family protein n=1 Tax=Aquabacterium sp. TaxID=1872578 RepID=UPI0035B28F9E
MSRRRKLLQGALGAATGWGLSPWVEAARQKPATSSIPRPVWRPDHTVVVVLENLSAFTATPAQRQGGQAPVYAPESDWRFLNELAAGGARFMDAHFARTPYGSDKPTRSSQPNYLYLFSGHHQGVLPQWFEDRGSPYMGTALYDRDGQPLPAPRETKVGIANNQIPLDWLPLQSPNLGAAIMKAGGRFLSFCESLPYPSWNCGTDDRLAPCQAAHAMTDDYRRKHNPAINWTDQRAPTSARGRQGDLAHHVLPVSVNLGFAPTRDPVLKQSFRGFLADEGGRALPFDALPEVSIVVPNEQHDAHSNTAKVADDWLRTHLGAYARWAREHNSLLIVTFDEDGSTDARRGDPYVTGADRIATVFYGAGVQPAEVTQRIDHLNVLATILWLYGGLEQFRADFQQYYRVQEGSGSPFELAWRNLQPITSVFREPLRS